MHKPIGGKMHHNCITLSGSSNLQEKPVKTATLPALRVSPELRESAERALRPNETLSKFMESSLQSFIEQRQAEDEFIARGLRAGEQAQREQSHVSVDAVMAELTHKLALAKRKHARSRNTAKP